ncbi:Rad52/Rad22 family DNA repair protein [Anaerospora sp.]|uniref:Rad52/Rad22 family DNA repair protein n=1 Tax=Anaerospora sp. TaxID=1960278 RepID=UPI00289C60CF|nr:Rad52/Rad22 family DNA repair protein [Anaerospora sp.]
MQLDPTVAIKKLQEPFAPSEIEWRVGATMGDKTKGIALAYVTNRAIQNRLDEVFGPFGWKNEFREWKNNSQLCGISIFFNGEWITKWDGADDSETEAIKGGLSDSMKRAAVQWGIGRYLYNLENEWVPIVSAGRSFKIKDIPRLPSWALPQGFSYENKGNSPQILPDVSTTAERYSQLAAVGAGKKGDITERQIAAIQKRAFENSISDNDFKDLLRFAFKVNTLLELDKSQASILIGDMKSLWGEYATKHKGWHKAV